MIVDVVDDGVEVSEVEIDGVVKSVVVIVVGTDSLVVVSSGVVFTVVLLPNLSAIPAKKEHEERVIREHTKKPEIANFLKCFI